MLVFSVAIVLLSTAAIPALAGSGSFNPTGSMNTSRIDHTATLLANGEVLVAGGTNNSTGYLSSAELYNPSTRKWAVTGSMTVPRDGHDAVLLPNGEVLVALENLEMSEREPFILINLSPMLILLTTLLAALRAIFRSRAALELENLALRHQIGVLQRSTTKRPKLTAGDRLVWVLLCRIWSDWRSALAIVQPEIVLAGTARAFVSSGHGRFGEAGREDPRLSTKSAT